MTGSEGGFETSQFSDLEQSYALGNKASLFDAISRSTGLGVPLPSWAASALKELVVQKWANKFNTWSGYNALLSNYLRSEVYRACMLWVKNKHHYKLMPTRCIQAWYDGDLDDLPEGKEEVAMTVALMGLVGTPAEKTSWEYLEKQRYFEAIPEADSLQVDDFETAEFLDMSPDEYRAYIAGMYRDHHKTPITFGYNDTEVIFGLRDAGQFWGPPDAPPPAKIQAILDAEPLP